MLAIFISMPFASGILIKYQTSDLIYSKLEDLPKKESALVLGAAAYPSGLSDILQDRVDSAIELYKAKKVTKLIMTGSYGESSAMAEYAIKKGVKTDDIIKDPNGIDTISSVKNTKNTKEITIVSQSFHLPRAIFLACHFKINAVGFSADKRDYTKIFDFKKRELLATSKAVMDVFFN